MLKLLWLPCRVDRRLVQRRLHLPDEKDTFLDCHGTIAVEMVRNDWIWGIWSLSQEEWLLGWGQGEGSKMVLSS